ncbi:hypothetical protein Taro_047128, partial [Colocasia esculenta]|nr:hypothetical protein [Colocasia esculenta]
MLCHCGSLFGDLISCMQLSYDFLVLCNLNFCNILELLAPTLTQKRRNDMRPCIATKTMMFDIREGNIMKE